MKACNILKEIKKKLSGNQKGFISLGLLLAVTATAVFLYGMAKTAEPHLYSNREEVSVDWKTVHELGYKFVGDGITVVFEPIPGTRQFFEIRTDTQTGEVQKRKVGKEEIALYMAKEEDAPLLQSTARTVVETSGPLTEQERERILDYDAARYQSYYERYQRQLEENDEAERLNHAYEEEKRKERDAREAFADPSIEDLLSHAESNKDIRVDIIEAIDGVYKEKSAGGHTNTLDDAIKTFMDMASRAYRGFTNTGLDVVKAVVQTLEEQKILAEEEKALQYRELRLNRSREADLLQEIAYLSGIEGQEGAFLSTKGMATLKRRKEQLAHTQAQIAKLEQLFMIAEDGQSADVEEPERQEEALQETDIIEDKKESSTVPPEDIADGNIVNSENETISVEEVEADTPIPAQSLYEALLIGQWYCTGTEVRLEFNADGTGFASGPEGDMTFKYTISDNVIYMTGNHLHTNEKVTEKMYAYEYEGFLVLTDEYGDRYHNYDNRG